jgi:hypothetical protein
LDRHLALDLLNHVRHGHIPEIPQDDKVHSVNGLREYMRLKGITVEMSQQFDGVTVPMIAQLPGKELWIDVHHPFVDPTAHLSDVEQKARDVFQEIVTFDKHTLNHDLPLAVARLGIPNGVVQ